MTQPRIQFLVFVLCLTALLAGCSSHGGGGGSSPAPTATLTASPTTITAGQATTLSYTSANADQGSIDNNVGTVGVNGSVHVSPATTTTYTFTASGPGGTATATATVTVNPAPAPTATLTASPTTITVGQGSALSFTSTNATQGSIDNGVGPVGISGSVHVFPATTTTYTFTATGAGGSATAQATVTVNPAPTVTATLTASAGVVFPGQSTTLTFSSTNATTGTINGTSVGTGGTIQETPNRTTTYTYVVSGPNGSASAAVTINMGNTFPGMSAADSSTPTETDIDPNGAVGQTQFMEYVNSQFQAYDKTNFQAVYAAPQAIGTLWQAAAIAECAAPNNITIDAVINYDRLASRWVVAAKAFDGTNYFFCIAVSNQDDLRSASWYAYDFDLTPYLTNPLGGVYLPDWPKLGTWAYGYYAAMDLVDTSTSTESGVLACAFDRADMLTGAAMKTPQCFTGPSSLLSNGVYLGHSLIPADVGVDAPPAGLDELMVSIQNPVNDGVTTTSDTINVWDFHVDWTTPANSKFTLTPVTVPTYTPACYLFKTGLPAYTNCIPEPAVAGIPQFVDSVGDRLMPRLTYRASTGYFLVSHAVQTNLDTTGNPWQTGIRWYQIVTNGSGTPSVSQSGTVSPDTSLYRFLPSISADFLDNVAVGYSTSSSSTNPGISFSYWNLDAAGATPTEVNIVSGTNGEEFTTGTGVGEWGTYSSMTVDPVDGCTFWYVNEYWVPVTGQSNSFSWATNIANFQIPGCQ